MNYKCLIVDDDITIAETTAEYFEMFDIKTAYVTGYDEAIEFLEENEVSLILLDINLGEKSGFALCKKIREDYDMPIFFISARKSDDNILMALNIGGDDYISKPYSMNVLLAKVKTVLARYEKAVEAAKSAMAVREGSGNNGGIPGDNSGNGGDPANTMRYQITEEMYLDTATHKLVRNNEIVSLKIMEYKMLLYLIMNKGRVITKDELLTNVWEDEFIGEGTLSVHARHLREKMEKDPKNPEIIKTIWGVGYIIES